MNTFIGIDLGWYGKPSGLASMILEDSELRLRNLTRLESMDEILVWIQTEAGSGSAVAGVDAPLVIRNQTSILDPDVRAVMGYRCKPSFMR
jgi:predicted RNase H-like nuclease